MDKSPVWSSVFRKSEDVTEDNGPKSKKSPVRSSVLNETEDVTEDSTQTNPLSVHIVGFCRFFVVSFCPLSVYY